VDRRAQLGERARVRRGLDAQTRGLVRHAQGLDLDDRGREREEVERLYALAVLDSTGIADERQRRARERLEAALALGLERAQRLDLLVEELDPERQIRREREHVDDVAALAQLPRTLGERHARVADLDQLREEIVDCEVTADLQVVEPALEILGRGHGLQEREQRRDHDARPTLARTGEDLRRLQAQAQRLGLG